MRNKGVKIVLTTSLVLAVMFAVKLNGRSSDDLNTNVSASLQHSDEISTTAGVSETLDAYYSEPNMKELHKINKVVKNEQPATTDEPKVLEEPTKPTDTYTSMIASRDWDADEGYLLAKIAMAEAEGEDVEGKALVICVVLNRVWYKDEFEDTIHDVIYEKNQFSPISNGRFDRVEPDKDCYEALEMVMMGWDESQGALYFESEKSADNWHSRHLEYLFTHGGHRFYK